MNKISLSAIFLALIAAGCSVHHPPAPAPVTTTSGSPIITTSESPTPTPTPTPVPIPNPSPPAVITYTVMPGDNLWNIALYYYGDGADYPWIAAANHIANPNLIYPQQVFVIP